MYTLFQSEYKKECSKKYKKYNFYITNVKYLNL